MPLLRLTTSTKEFNSQLSETGNHDYDTESDNKSVLNDEKFVFYYPPVEDGAVGKYLTEGMRHETRRYSSPFLT